MKRGRLLKHVNHTRIYSWNQPVQSNEGKVWYSMKQREYLMGLIAWLSYKESDTPPTTPPRPYSCLSGCNNTLIQTEIHCAVRGICTEKPKTYNKNIKKVHDTVCP